MGNVARMRVFQNGSVALVAGVLALACDSRPEMGADKHSPQGKAVMAQVEALRQEFDVDLRSATVLDGVNVNVLRIDMRSKDKTLADRVTTAQKVARFLKSKGALPEEQYRVSFDFPVSFQVGCAPVNLYERVQLDTKHFNPIQVLPAQRVMSYDGLIRGGIGETILDDAQWNIPFFLNVDQVEIAQEVMGVTAKPDESFVSVHAVWTNIGTAKATMSDDPWRLVEGGGAKEGQVVAILDGGSTHLARNDGRIKMDVVEPGHTRERWYVFRVPNERLKGGAITFARQRFAKSTFQDKDWKKAGYEIVVPIKDANALGGWPQAGKPLIVTSSNWSSPQAAPAVAAPH